MRLNENRHLSLYYQKFEDEIDGKNVKSAMLQTINLDNQIQTHTSMGLIPVNYSLNDTDFDLDSFEKLPGLYKIKCKSKIGPKNKGQILVPDKITFGKETKIDTRTDGAILILGANYIKTATIKGTKLFYCDPETEGKETENTESLGKPIIETWLEKQSLDIFKELPGWYDCEFTLVRSGPKGEEKIKILKLNFLSKFDINALLNSSPQPNPGQ